MTGFLVWKHNRLSRENIGDLEFRRDGRALLRAESENTFVIKVNRWLAF